MRYLLCVIGATAILNSGFAFASDLGFISGRATGLISLHGGRSGFAVPRIDDLLKTQLATDGSLLRLIDSMQRDGDHSGGCDNPYEDYCPYGSHRYE